MFNNSSTILGLIGAVIHTGGQDFENIVKGASDDGAEFEQLIKDAGLPSYGAGDFLAEAETYADKELTDVATIPDSILEKFAVPGADLEKAKSIRDEIAQSVALIPQLVLALRTVADTTNPPVNAASEPVTEPEKAAEPTPEAEPEKAPEPEPEKAPEPETHEEYLPPAEHGNE